MIPVLLLALSILCLAAAAFCAQDVVRELLAPRLAPCACEPADGPFVSVLIPARDEAARIGGCLDGLARQTHRRFEVVVVDDHSSDGTAEVVRGYAGRLPELAVVLGAALPPGWAGKPWACYQAAERARAELLVFLDADVIPRPGLLAALVARAEAGRLDLLTLMPFLRLGSAAERVVLPAFMALLYDLYPLREGSDPRSPVAFANGQCLLVRRQAYNAIGGHAAVRASILEDTELGQRAKAAGLLIAAAAAPELIEVRMYTGWASLAEGLGKNAVAGYQSGGRRSGLVGARQALVAFLPVYLLAAGALLALAMPGARLAGALLAHGAALGVVAMLCWGWIAWHRYRVAPWWGALFPLGTAIYFWLAARALLRLRTGRGVTWKGRTFG
jgi:cellulose synthase/poly-beta-1,6-N-acetylglucosamine synthase-like glycosyltransferase